MSNACSTVRMREGTGHARAYHKRCHSGGGFLQVRCVVLAVSSRYGRKVSKIWEGRGGGGRNGKEGQEDVGWVVFRTTHLRMVPQRWLGGTAACMPYSTLPLRVRPVQLWCQLLRKYQLRGGRNMTWVGSLCRGWQRRQNWGRSSDGMGVGMGMGMGIGMGMGMGMGMGIGIGMGMGMGMHSGG